MADPSKILCTLDAFDIQNLDCDYFLGLLYELVPQMTGHYLLYHILAEIKRKYTSSAGLGSNAID